MENLEISYRRNISLEGTVIKSTVKGHITCVVTDTGRVHIFNDLKNKVSARLPVDLEKNQTNLVCLEYLDSWNIVVFVTKEKLVIFRLENLMFLDSYNFKNEVILASCNPSESYFVVLDNTGKLFGLTFEYDPSKHIYNFIVTNESSLTSPVPSSVYVGWGSSDTQFKGTRKKLEAQEEHKAFDLPQPYSDPRISWRGNGEQFALNYWHDTRRILKVFNNNLEPQYENNTHPSLLAPVAFKGQGNCIACVALGQREQPMIVIFEKNCLVKDTFDIPYNKGTIKDVKYHPEWNMLAVHSQDGEQDYLNIYLTFNGRWYFKSQLLFNKNDLSLMHWTNVLEKSGCTLTCVTSNTIEKNYFKKLFYRYPESDLVAVVDGPFVYFTMFDEESIPPPKNKFSIDFDEPIVKIVHDPTSLTYQVHSFNKCFIIKQVENEFQNFSEVDSELPYDDSENGDILYKDLVIFNEIPYTFSLNGKEELLLDDIVIFNNVLSMFLYEEYLLITLASNELLCLKIANLVSPSKDSIQYYSREVDKGAKIVTVTSRGEIVLQITRGNLECVTCRLIVIENIEKLLQQDQWDQAISKVRLERLNWNLLIDLNPSRFCQNTDKFIFAANTASLLNTIVSEISLENCLETMYAECFIHTNADDNVEKVEVLKKILHDLVNSDCIENLLSIVTIQAKHFSFKSALETIKSLFVGGFVEESKAAVHQILQYSNTKEISSLAISLYEAPFMRLVLDCCIEDPKVYEPELQRILQIENIVEQRFQVNLLAKKYENATKFLVRIPSNISQYSEDYIADFISRHKTQQFAYETLLGVENFRFPFISKLYASFLSYRGHHEEAALVLERVSLQKEALEEYCQALNSFKVIALLNELEFKESEKKNILMSLAEDLVQHKKVFEAVNIYEKHCREYQKAVSVLTEHKHFQKALVLAQMYGLDKFAEEFIIPEIVKYRNDLLERIFEFNRQYNEHLNRLVEIRQNKINKLKRTPDEVCQQNVDFEDIRSELGSIISSAGSRTGSRSSSVDSDSSRSSTMSSRNRRKHEKKKIDLRPGGTFEDIALIRHLYLLAVDISDLGEEVHNICLTLTDLQSFKFSKLLHRELLNLQSKVKESINIVWSPTFLNGTDNSEPDVAAVIQNRNELDFIYRTPPITILDKFNSWNLSMFS